MRFPARGLYLVTPDVDAHDAAALLARSIDLLPYVRCLQYRNKRADAARGLQEARAWGAACRAAGVCFIVNDDPQLALEAEADGVHLGRADAGIEAARRLLGAERAIGVSCYDDIARAHAAARAGADYVAFGALFPSATKPFAPRAAPALFAQAAALHLPRVAIGGINADNAEAAVAAGADLIAVIAGVFGAPDPALAARKCAAAFR